MAQESLTTQNNSTTQGTTQNNITQNKTALNNHKANQQEKKSFYVEK